MALTETMTLTFANRNIVAPFPGMLYGAYPSGTTKFYFQSEPGVALYDQDFPRALAFAGDLTAVYRVIEAGTETIPGSPPRPYAVVDVPIRSGLAAGCQYVVVNLCADSAFALIVDIISLHRGVDPCVGFVNVQGMTAALEHVAGSAFGDVSPTPTLDPWEPLALASYTDGRYDANLINVASGSLARGDRIRIGSASIAEYDILEYSGTSAHLSKPFPFWVGAQVNGDHYPFSTAAVTPFSGMTAPSSSGSLSHVHGFDVESGLNISSSSEHYHHVIGSTAGEDPQHDHGMGHGHALPTIFTTTIALQGVSPLFPTSGYCTIRGIEYPIASRSTASVTIGGGLSGPLSDGDDVLIHSVPGGTLLYGNLWSKHTQMVLPPVEYSGHILLAYAVSGYRSETDYLSSASEMAQETVLIARTTPIPTVTRIDDLTYDLEDRHLAPGKFLLAGYRISNRWGTQQLGVETPLVKFTNPDEPGFRAGA